MGNFFLNGLKLALAHGTSVRTHPLIDLGLLIKELKKKEKDSK